MIGGEAIERGATRNEPAVRTRPAGSDGPLSEAYDTALLDLDGVVYAGGHAIAHAVESLAARGPAACISRT